MGGCYHRWYLILIGTINVLINDVYIYSYLKKSAT